MDVSMQRERKEQEWFVRWFKLQYPRVLIAASANGGRRDCQEAMNMKREGVEPGMPDLQIFKAYKGFHGLFIEMKAPKTIDSAKGRLSNTQKDKLIKLNEEGYLALTAWGMLEAQKIVRDYFHGENLDAKDTVY